jgi:hypothetical protein
MHHHSTIIQSLPPTWVHESHIPEAITAEALLAAMKDGVAEVRGESPNLMVRLAPHHVVKRRATAGVCLSPDEMTKLQAAADAQGLSVSATIHAALEACGLLA